MVPAADRGKTISVATDGMSPPWDQVVNGKVSGVDADLLNQAAVLLNVKFSFTVANFVGIIPGVESGRFGLSMDAMADTTVREKLINFIDYSTEATAIVVKKGNPEHITKITQFCGKTIDVLIGSVFVDFINLADKGCKPPVNMVQVPTESVALAAVASGRADATFDDYGTASYLATHSKTGLNAELQPVLGVRIGEAYQGIGFAKDKTSHALMLAVRAALLYMVKTGAYQKVYDTWGIHDLSTPKLPINDGGHFKGL
jgi:polar amino acid transport system substrate-binding protein